MDFTERLSASLLFLLVAYLTGAVTAVLAMTLPRRMSYRILRRREIPEGTETVNPKSHVRVRLIYPGEREPR